MTGVTSNHVPNPLSAPSIGGAGSASSDFLRLITLDFARAHLVLSHGASDGVERLAIADSTPPLVVHNVSVRLGRRIETIVMDTEELARAIDEAYRDHAPSGATEEHVESDEPGDDLDELLADADRDLLSTQGKAPIVRLVDGLLFDAVGRGASDVHIEPQADVTHVRCRLDGVMHTTREIPRGLTAAVVSRIKVMGRMDIAERRVPQDGRATVTIGSRPTDLRISTLPTAYGERAVMRLLDTFRNAELLSLTALGMPAAIEQRFLERAGRSSGIVLVTGPTGSGKTTTLYATLRWSSLSARGGRNIMTLEDPVEYELSDKTVTISQAQVNPKKGVTFARGLRHILRQDPDVIMVGEIRDVETAKIAIQSSLTGHLVFSTLHTNDAASAVTRLADLGVEPYLIGATLSAVLAQRLARRLHDACDGAGCEECLQTGFRGRTGIFELLTVDAALRELIASGASVAEIRAASRRAGMRSLIEEGRRLAEAGVTTEHEALRVVEGANE